MMLSELRQLNDSFVNKVDFRAILGHGRLAPRPKALFGRGAAGGIVMVFFAWVSARTRYFRDALSKSKDNALIS